jgi:CRISPR-associated protein (TIGR02584 family)
MRSKKTQSPLGAKTSPVRRRILVCATGLSPQIVTETIYALSVVQKPAWIPTEVRLITTSRGAEYARLMLLSEKPGWFQQLLRDWHLPPIQFDETHIEVLRDSNGGYLEDIRDDADNQRAADGIAELIRHLTEDEASEIHVSVAGGRKTMGFFIGYALSLWGRPQDKLSHVLVSSPFESRAEFYYPTPKPHILPGRAPGQDPLDASTAKVWLGDIAFVRLRSLLPAGLNAKGLSYAQAVAAANQALDQVTLEIDARHSSLKVNRQALRLPPMQLSILTLLAWRCQQKRPPLRAPNKLLEDDRDWKEEVFKDLCRAVGELNIPSSLYDKLKGKDPIAATFEQQLSKLQRTLRDSGAFPLRELITREAINARQRGYRLNLLPDHIQILSSTGKLAKVDAG